MHDGGTQFVYSGGAASSTTVNGGGRQVISAGGNATGTNISGGGHEVIAAGSATGTVFLDAGVIDVADMPFVSAATGTVTAVGVLTVTQGMQSYTQQLDAASDNEKYTVSSDGAGGTDDQRAMFFEVAPAS